MRVPDEEEDPHQNDGVPPLRDQTNQQMIPVLTQDIPAQKTVNTQVNKPIKKPTITFQNTTGSDVVYHDNAFNPDTQQIAQYFELSKCSKGHLTNMTYPIRSKSPIHRR
mmetsp:Transcript_26852/g.38097  ORF Transcript_26852/g.38097 Transcript_26852/m.38097 type:complete len:109 (+) Transcript_26852:588-914(+)